MNEIAEILAHIRKSLPFLWDEYGFQLVGLMPKDGYRDSGYFAQLENGECTVAFQSESGYLDDVGVVPRGETSSGEFVSRWALMSKGEKEKPLQLPHTAANVFSNFAEFATPHLREMAELAKTPVAFEERLKELEATTKSKSITVDMIRDERARLHSLGLDSSLGAALENLRKRDKDE